MTSTRLTTGIIGVSMASENKRLTYATGMGPGAWVFKRTNPHIASQRDWVQ